MAGPILDDIYHIFRACELIGSQTFFRPLIYWLTCMSGESLMATRLISLIALGLTAYFLSQLMPLKRAKDSRFAAWIAFVHPIALFPVFYASQISTALMLAWASATAYVLLRFPANRFLWHSIAAILLLIVGQFLRLETLAYALMIMGVALLYSWIQNKPKTFREFLPSSTQLVALLVFTALFFLASEWQRNIQGGQSQADLIRTVVNAAESATDEQPYPKSSHFAVQIWAIALYLRNYFSPFHASFYGPWSDWWTIHQSSSLQYLLYSAYLVILFGLSGLFFFFFARDSKPVAKVGKWTCSGLLVFILVCTATSLVIRVDWYYPSREILACLLMSFFFTAGVDELESGARKKALRALFGFAALSLAYTYIFHYKDNLTFARFEGRGEGKASPRTWREAAKMAIGMGSMEEALRYSHHSYTSVPEPTIAVSPVAREFWEEALYSGYLISRELGQKKSMASSISQLMRSQSFISTAACLSDQDTEIEKCTTELRRKYFCQVWKSDPILPPIMIREDLLRISPQEFCKG